MSAEQKKHGTHSPQAPRYPAQRWQVIACCLILLISGLIRFYASLGDFWLDEIWAWNIVVFSEKIVTDLDILTNVHSATNHYLNSWFFYLLDPSQHWIVFRIPSVLAGVGTVAVAGLIGRRHGRVEGFSAMLLTSGSYMLVHYSSEARGYGMMLFFSLLCFYLLDKSHRGTRPRTNYGFALSAILGFLAHLEFVFCYAGLVSWSLWRFARDDKHRKRNTWINLRCFAAPTTFIVWLYLVDISRLHAVGGDILPLDQVLVDLLALVVGMEGTNPLAIVVSIGVVLAATYGLYLLRGEEHHEWVFHLVTILIAPILIAVITHQKYLYPRHFLVCWIFVLLLVNHALASLTRWKSKGTVVLGLLLAAILGSNALHIGRLIQVGRGQYQEALQMINARTNGPFIIIGSDFRVRNEMVLRYYERRIPGLKRIAYIPDSHWPEEGVEWYLIHRFERDEQADSDFRDEFGNRYQLTGEFPYAGLSGWKWAVYHNDNYNAPTKAQK